MRIEVRFRGVEASDELRGYVVRRVRFQLSRFSDEVSSVVVRISDVNGPKGGADKRCQVAVRGPALVPITIEDMSGDAQSAADLALGRAGRTVARELERARTPHAGPIASCPGRREARARTTSS